MLRYDQKLKNIRRIIYVFLSIFCWISTFFYIDSDIWCLGCLGASIGFLIVFVLSYKKPKQNRKLNLAIKKAMNDSLLSLDEIKKKYKYYELNGLNILKIFYNDTLTERVLIIQESNAVKVVHEKLRFYDDGEKIWCLSFAQWVDGCNLGTSLYADAETAINDNKILLENFYEENINFDKKQNLTVEIEWKDIDVNSKLLPFGLIREFDFLLGKKKIKNVQLENIHWFDLNKSKAFISINEKDKLDEDKNYKFYILNKDKIIGIARYYKN